MRFVGFGCSWMYGSELVDPELDDPTWQENTPYRQDNCFLGLLGPNDNFSEPGNSIDGMFYEFMRHQETADPETFYVFALTSADRTSWYDSTEHKWEHSSWVKHDKKSKFRNSFTEYVSHSFSDEFSKTRHCAFVSSIANTCKVKGFKYIIFNALTNPTFADKNFMWPGYSMEQALHGEQAKGRKNYFAPDGHPNEQGHRWIAGRVKEHIDTLYPGLL